MKNTIFDFLENYGTTVLCILGVNECKSVYGYPFVLWYQALTANNQISDDIRIDNKQAVPTAAKSY